MKHLVNKHILSSWEFQAPVCLNNYDDFANGLVEFQVRATATPAAPSLPAKSDAELVFDYDTFLALR